MSDADIFQGDCREVLACLDADSIDSVVTDPPYDLTSGKKGGTGDKSMNVNSPAGRSRISTGGGFMGLGWDSTGVAFDPATWAAVLRVMKPGAYLLAFGGTRTYHRMVCAIEDAGFEIRDSLHWIYGTGFPKSLNLGEGRGTALKPAHEPIVLARKPPVGTTTANVLAFGTGGLNIDGCRIECNDKIHVPQSDPTKRVGAVGTDLGISRSKVADFQEAQRASIARTMDLGRFPANVLFDEDAATELEASRFFYCAKPSRSERDRGVRNTHPTVKPLALMQWLVRLVTPMSGTVLDPFMGSGTTGMAAGAEDRSFIGIEQDPTYLAIAEARMAAMKETA